MAAIAVGKDGHAHLLTVDSDAISSWSQLIAEVPDLVARLAHTVGDRVTLELKTRGVKAADGLSGGDNHGALPEKSEAKK